MNSNPSFRLFLALLVLVVSAGAAGAVTVSEQNTPSEVEVGARVSATYTFTELYREPNFDEWTLQGETELRSVTWTVTLIDQAGNEFAQQSYDGTLFNQSISVENDVDEVEVQLTGTVPEVGNWSYESGQPITFAAYRLNRQGGTSTVIQTYSATRYTEESQEARQAIQSARSAIEDAGGNRQAQRTLDNAISAYNAGNFGNAVDLANQARDTAQGAQQRSQLVQLVLMAVVALVVIGAVVGGVIWYRSRQGESKL